jgi:RNA-directed DNA polymerase
MLEALERGVKGGVWFSLIDKVYNPRTLQLAWKRVAANKGSAGSDFQSVKAFGKNLDRELRRLHEELRGGTYRPRPIRRVYIDKPGSTEKRPLGIPAVRDRVIQTALRIVMEPIFEKEFLPTSFGFRPKRGPKDALRRVARLLEEGHTHVVDADLRRYFDSIPHDRLMAEIETRIADSRILDLIKAYLEQGIVEGLELWNPTEGTPQGAVISPLLANLFLHPFDEAMKDAGYELVRYADDFVILCRTKEQAESAYALARKLLEGRGLTLHPEKSKIVNALECGGFDFLGYHFERGKRWPGKKAVKKLKHQVRRKTRRNNGHSLAVIIESLNLSLRGWFEYFKHGRPWDLVRLDGWVRRRLRSILRTRSGRRGLSRGRDHQRWPNTYFHEHGLFSLKEAYAHAHQSAGG